MRYRYFICDVFTRERFCGNPVAVLPQAEGLSSVQMQQITREFNFSETTFVLAPEKGNTRKVRIFTPAKEIPFAGHPNIGTAFALATDGAFGEISKQRTVTFEEQAGLVPVSIQPQADGMLWCELAASALRIETADISTSTHMPQLASVGLPFLMVELQNLEALEKIRVKLDALEKLQQQGISPDILVYIHSTGNADIRARMFAPLDGVPEDPATGSANCALAAMLSYYDEAENGDYSWRILQGVEMGRPSILDARTEKRDGVVSGTWIGGNCVMVSTGEIEVD
jgi:trans-2,3-dihydro-3-hydroxyanthranilate isomerase